MEEISGSMSSLSFGRQAMKVDMLSRSQGQEGTFSDGGNFGSKMFFSAWAEMPCTQSDRRKAGGCMRDGVSSQDVSEHHTNKVMITLVVPWE
jgi:hypothetical protein